MRPEAITSSREAVELQRSVVDTDAVKVAARSHSFAGKRLGDPLPQRGFLLGCLLALLWFAFALSTILRPTQGYNLWLDVVLYESVFALAAVVCLSRWWAVGEDRGAWIVIGAGLALFCAGGVYSSVWLGESEVPTPSAADVLWWSFYLSAYAALALLVRRRVARFYPSMLLDGAVAALGAGSLIVAFLLGDVITDTTGPLREVATNISYPTADVLLLMIVVGLLSVIGARLSSMWILLAAGFIVYAVGDTIFLFEDASGAYNEGGPLDVTWPLAALLVALASLGPDHDRTLERLEGPAVLAVPILFSVSSIALLVLDQFQRVPLGAVLMAAATLTLVLVRVGLTFRELGQLADSRRQAKTDDLTGLLNRRGFYAALRERLGGGRDASHAFSILLMDLDRFKEVNDSLGHSIGDDLLRRLGPRIRRALRSVDVLARLGGDEFAIVVDGDESLARRIAQRVLSEIRRPLSTPVLTMHVDASIGMSFWPADGATVEELLARADIAMYAAKQRRSGFESYDAERDRESLTRLEVVEALRAALQTDEIVLHYQPKIVLADGSVSGAEALVRWQHPSEGLVLPGRFLPLAKQAGLMRPLTDVVLRLAAQQSRRWLEAGLDLPVSVNLSAASLHDPGLPDALLDVIRVNRLTPYSLMIEITEDELMVDPAASTAVLEQLHARGIRISLDDFGTGQSSLAYLRELPVDELKLDRSFLTLPYRSDRLDAIVSSTVSLAHALGVPIVAEGVEDRESLDRLMALGCDEAQGYFFSAPLPAADLTLWLEERTARQRDDSGGHTQRVRVGAVEAADERLAEPGQIERAPPGCSSILSSSGRRNHPIGVRAEPGAADIQFVPPPPL